MKAHERGIFKQQGAEDAGSCGSRPSEWRKPRPSPRLLQTVAGAATLIILFSREFHLHQQSAVTPRIHTYKNTALKLIYFLTCSVRR